MTAIRREIRKQLSQPRAVELIRRLLDGDPSLNRTKLAGRLCEQFGFLDSLGHPQTSGCLKVLRRLASKELFELPSPQTKPGRPRPRRLGYSVPQAKDVPHRVDEVQGLELTIVETEAQMRTWNELFACEHPRGPGPLVGRQLRYLIGSDHGWLGGFAFAASAWRLRDRDRWIGWDDETRQKHLDQIVGLSRFLIRNSVDCRNLASKTLSMAVQRLPSDFEARYGYRPWLVETFVDTECFEGTCYQAANWIRVGSSRGMGRHDSPRYGEETVKDIFLYPLVDDFRERMGLSSRSGLGPLPMETGLDSENWAEYEFGGAPLGDRRLSRRLVVSASVQAEHPGRAFCGIEQASDAMKAGHYRFIEQPDESGITMENILAPHREQTIRRMQAEKTVLCVQDGTVLNFNDMNVCEGLDVIGANQTKAKTRGIHLHSMMAVTDTGLPLGILRTQHVATAPKDAEDERKPAQVPIEEKKTYCWMEGLEDCTAMAAAMPHTQIVCVMDREADFFELFDAWRQNPRVDLLVRAAHDRCTTNDRKLFETVKSSTPQLRFSLHVERQSSRPKKSKQKARPARPERTAELTLRFCQIALKPPVYHREKESVPLWIVHVLEENPPTGENPVEWYLLTTKDLQSADQARTCLEWYCWRWRIEDWHRVLKSGCNVEELQYKTAERLKRAVAINAVIAWRLMLLTLLGRETPELPPEVFLTQFQIMALQAYAEDRGLPPPNTLGAAVLLIAKMGGYMARKHDPPPGHEIMWRGYTFFRTMAVGYELAWDRLNPT